MANSRKWLITINNPLEHGFDHARIRAAVMDLPSLVYLEITDERSVAKRLRLLPSLSALC